MAITALDIDHNNDHQAILNWAATFNCKAKLINKNGPAGGNPVYSFSGSLKNIVELIDDYRTNENMSVMGPILDI